jgi:hypothetical protein
LIGAACDCTANGEEQMPGLVTHTIDIAQVTASSGQVAQIEIDKIAPGAVKVAGLNLTGTSLAIKSGAALLQNVRFVLQLKLTLDWWYDFGIFGSDSGSDDLGSLFFPFNAGNVVVPALNNISLSIPNIAATNVTAGIAPILNLALGSAGFTGLLAAGVALPSGGFQLGGLELGPVSIASLQTPDASVGKVSIAEFAPTGSIVVPSVQLNNIELPSASAADIQSVSPFAINNIQASAQGISVSFGIFGFTFLVTPIINTNIGSLTLSGVTLSGSVSKAEIQNVSVPVVITGINLKTITIGAIDVTNITL